MMMIDEEIAHEREIAEEQRKDNENCEYKAEYGCKGCVDYYDKPCIECAEEHEQLAEWLEELKELREKAECARCVYNCGCIDEIAYKQGYNKAIDDFAELLKGNLVRKYANSNLTQQYVALQVTDWCNEIARQLKAGGENE